MLQLKLHKQKNVIISSFLQNTLIQCLEKKRMGFSTKREIIKTNQSTIPAIH